MDQQIKMKSVTFNYDDGCTQDVRLIELLNKYGLKCTFNLNSELLFTKCLYMWGDQRIARYRVHPKDVKPIYEGHEVAAHTLTHALLPNCTDEEVIRQVEEDRLNLSELVGYEVVGMAYPGDGRGTNCDDRVANIIKNHTGVQYCRTTTSTNAFDWQDNLYRFNPTEYHLNFENLMRLGEEFISLTPTEPKVFCIWGHSYEMDYSADYWIKLEEFFQLISNKSDIFYGTNKEVLRLG